ncbi:MAG: DUF4402 domain-containing protein [Massilia sp.]|nr:DUF4402 domain-containing protein [Massilia sp.]
MNTTRHIGRGAPRSPAAALLALLALLLAATAAAAPSVPPKSIATASNLGFGRFAAAGGGAINVSPAGVRARTGSVVLLPSSVAAAAFTISGNGQGNDNKVYVLTLPANGSVTLAAGANRMAVNSFTSNLGAGAPLPTGTQSVTVGATLQVSPNQPPGAYSGNFNVTLEYQ